MASGEFLLGAVLYAISHYQSYVNRLLWKDLHKYSEIVSLDSETDFRAENNGKLVLVKGTVWGTKPPRDKYSFRPILAPKHSIGLIRNVEKCVPTGKYSCGWVPDSDVLDMGPSIFYAPSCMGSFWISKDFMDNICKVGQKVPLEVSHKEIAIEQSARFMVFKKNENWYYYTKNKGRPTKPQIGDIRINYSYVPPSEVTILAKQQKFKLEPFHSPTSSVIPGEHNLHQFIDAVTFDKYQFVCQWLGVGLMAYATYNMHDIKTPTKVALLGGTTGGLWLGTRIVTILHFGRVLIPAVFAGGTEYALRLSRNEEHKSQ